jgi:hypothetical protein
MDRALPVVHGSTSTPRLGWTAGGSVEYMFASHWTVKAEYLLRPRECDLRASPIVQTTAAGVPFFGTTTAAHATLAVGLGAEKLPRLNDRWYDRSDGYVFSRFAARHAPRAHKRARYLYASPCQPGLRCVPLCQTRPIMLQNVSAEIIYCRECARRAREKAEAATGAEAKRDYLAAEARWLGLAHSHELQQRLSTMLGEGARIAASARNQGRAFEPEIVANISCAFRDVFTELGLANRDEIIALEAARLIIGFAAQGERDPERLKVATLAWMK